MLVDKGNELLKVDGAFNAIGRFSENRADKTVLTAQNIQRLFILIMEVFSGFLEQVFPAIPIRDSRRFEEELNALAIHLQKEQIGELREIVGEAYARTGHDVGQLPDLFGNRSFLDLSFSHFSYAALRMNSLRVKSSLFAASADRQKLIRLPATSGIV